MTSKKRNYFCLKSEKNTLKPKQSTIQSIYYFFFLKHNTSHIVLCHYISHFIYNSFSHFHIFTFSTFQIKINISRLTIMNSIAQQKQNKKMNFKELNIEDEEKK